MDDVKVGRFISLILRHKPETIGITLDRHGWADVDELLDGMRKSGINISLKDLERIVVNNNKKRYSFNEDKTKIRANQGHSINVDVELKEKVPPQALYHGTGIQHLESIMKNGLNKASRLHVHLSMDVETAVIVGKRHGKPVVLEIDSGEMHSDGYKFYLSENNVWLCDEVPVKYITPLD